MVGNQEEALEFFEFLSDADCITQVQKLALDHMSQAFVEGTRQFEIGLDLIAKQKTLEYLWLEHNDLSSGVLIQLLDRLMTGAARTTLKELGLSNAVMIDRQSGERIIDLINCAPGLSRVDIRRTGSHEPQSYKLRIERDESTGVQTRIGLIETTTIATTTNEADQ